MEPDRGAEELIGELSRRGATMAVAESCTGGLVASTLTAVPGASRVLWGSAVVYGVGAKERMLGLDRSLLQREGSVSATVTEALAAAVLERSGVDLAAAVTGWAGPGSDGPDPVGTVYVALADGAGSSVRRLRLDGDRSAVRRQATTELIAGALGWIRGGGGERDDR